MRHRLKKRKLNMDYDRRRAVIKNLLRTLLTKGKVETTLARGRYLLSVGERTISRIKKADLNARRELFRLFQNQALVNQVVESLAQLPKRKGGFLRLRRIKRRRGDNAVVVRIEFVDKVKLGEEEKEEQKEVRDEKEKEQK